MKVQYPDYTKSITNLSCSVLAYFGVKDIKHNTLPELDEILNERKPRNIVYMVFDAMGTSILDRHLPKDSFLQRKLINPISSTFPPTTVAATTAINTGLTPYETGWLGWFSYFKEIDQNVITFFNTLQSNPDQQAAPYNLAWKNIPYKSLSMQIKEVNPNISCTAVSPFRINGTDDTIISTSLESTCQAIVNLSNQNGKHFIYSYWPDPDHMMHEIGIDKPQITDIVQDINNRLESLSETLKDDTLVIVTADHGHINSKWFLLCDYPDLQALLLRPHSMENRAASLFVKPGKQEEFKTLFHKHFGDHFILMPHDQFIESGMLGNGEMNPNVQDFVGDFVALAIDEYCLGETTDDKDTLVGIHAGLTDEEMNVPLIVF